LQVNEKVVGPGGAHHLFVYAHATLNGTGRRPVLATSGVGKGQVRFEGEPGDGIAGLQDFFKK
jgi:hypothetical protein